MRVEMKMPDLATTDSEIRIVRWIVEPGQRVRRGEPLVEIETDKAAMEVEAVVGGTLQAVRAQAGDAVVVGQVIAVFEVDLPAATAATAAAAAQSKAAKVDALADLPPTKPKSPAASVQAATSPDAPIPGGMFAKKRQSTAPCATTSAEAVPAVAPQCLQASSGTQSESGTPSEEDTPSDSAPLPPIAAERLAAYAPEQLLAMYRRMAEIRQFEDGIKFLFLEGTMPGTIHQCQGQEATAVGVCSALRPSDFITSTFRGHGHALAKGLSVQELLDELFGASTGCCKGKGGSMHVGNMAKGMLPGIAIVGGGIPVATGMALAFSMQKTEQVVACFFGDGAVAEGAFHEGVNMAAIWNLPVVFACENNLYGASTHVSKVMRDTNIARRVKAYGIRAERLDGNDVLAVYEAARSAVADCRSGRGPVFLEMLTYRSTGHSRRDPRHYQPKDEQAVWAANDPIVRLGDDMLRANTADETRLAAIRAELEVEFQAAVDAAKKAPLPTPDDLTTDVLVS